MINKFPLYTQNEAMDCGTACLRMVAKYYEHHYSLKTLQKKCFILPITETYIVSALINMNFEHLLITPNSKSPKREHLLTF